MYLKIKKKKKRKENSCFMFKTTCMYTFSKNFWLYIMRLFTKVQHLEERYPMEYGKYGKLK